MSVSLQPTDPEVEFIGHTYRLSEDQYRRAIDAGIITEVDGVDLQDGFLCLKSGPHDDPAEGHYRLSVDQYRAMGRLDILTTDDRVELLEGWLVAKMTKKPRHEIAKGLTQDLLTALTPADWFVMIEGPTDAIDSDPEPDLMIVRGSRRDYSEGSPGPGSVALVVEVADSSLSRDRSTKKRLYARSGYAIYWLINLVANRSEVYTGPTGPIEEPDYLQRQDIGPDAMIPVVIAGQEVGRLAVRDLLP